MIREEKSRSFYAAKDKKRVSESESHNHTNWQVRSIGSKPDKNSRGLNFVTFDPTGLLRRVHVIMLDGFSTKA